MKVAGRTWRMEEGRKRGEGEDGEGRAREARGGNHRGEANQLEFTVMSDL